MVDETSPKARQNFATTQSSRFLSEAEATARELLGRTMNTARAAGGAAGAAQGSADDAQADATQALADAATAQSAANAAQATANGKLALAAATTLATDADATFTPAGSNSLLFHTGTLTADRAITLGVGTDKYQVRVVRTGAGAFNLVVNGKAMATNTWADFYYATSAWVITAYGAL